MEKLKDLLNEYNMLTDKIMDELSGQEYDAVNLSLDSREEIIKKIKETDYEKDEFNKISRSLNLEKKEANLNKALKDNLKEKIDKLSKISEAKYANREYKKSYSPESIFINKKI